MTLRRRAGVLGELAAEFKGSVVRLGLERLWSLSCRIGTGDHGLRC